MVITLYDFVGTGRENGFYRQLEIFCVAFLKAKYLDGTIRQHLFYLHYVQHTRHVHLYRMQYTVGHHSLKIWLSLVILMLFMVMFLSVACCRKFFLLQVH